LAEIIELRASEAAPESLALCVEISGVHDDVYTYDMYFQAASDAAPGDWMDNLDGLTCSCRARASTVYVVRSWT